MSQFVGRQGWLGAAIESSPGVPSNPSDYVPFVQNTLRGKHEPFADIAARGTRHKEYTSVEGKKWGEGELTVNLDPTFSGYFFKLALGTEDSSQLGSTGVYDHTFTVADTNSTPQTASFISDRGDVRELYTNSVVDELEISVADGLATLKSTVRALFPVTSVSGSNTTTSGIVFSFKDLTVRFGSTLAAAQTATPTKVTNLNLKIKNNAEPVFKSGSNQPASWDFKEFEVDGEFGIMLEDNTELTNYYNLTKRYAIFTFEGRGIGGGYREQVEITLYQMRIQDQPIETGVENLFALTSQFVGEYSQSDSKMIQVVCRNRKSSTY